MFDIERERDVIDAKRTRPLVNSAGALQSESRGAGLSTIRGKDGTTRTAFVKSVLVGQGSCTLPLPDGPLK